jgi:phage anti-repressor protein
MKLSEIKQILKTLDTVEFQLEDGSFVPEHFHVTEVGQSNKHFIDCGGVTRTENRVNFQLWNADDYEHRLKPAKLLHIIELSEKTLHIGDYEIEVEYQSSTIGKYGLDFNGKHFILTNKTTACLAEDACGIPSRLTVVEATANSCTPGSGCC